MNPRKLVPFFAVVAFAAAACGQPATQASPTSAPPTIPPAATAAPTTAASNPAPASAATTQLPVPTTAPQPAAPAAAVSPAARAAGDSTTLRIVPADSEARFVAREQLLRNTIQSDAIGRTNAVAGQIVVGPNGQVQTGSQVTVDVSTLKSDSNGRDGFIKRNTLQTDQFPQATFVPTSAEGLPNPLPQSGDASFSLLGDLTVHGVSKPATWDVNATFDGADVKGTATTVVQLAMFDMPVPHVPAVASIADDIRLELDFHAMRGS